MEMGSLVNSGDRTFVTANPQDQALARAIKFALPSGALGVQMQSGLQRPGRHRRASAACRSPARSCPGSHEFALSFQLPYTGSSADVSMQMPYPTGTYSVYLPDTGIKLDASGLDARAARPSSAASRTRCTRATNLPKATMVGGQLSGLGSNRRGRAEPAGADQPGRRAVRAGRRRAPVRRPLAAAPAADAPRQPDRFRAGATRAGGAAGRARRALRGRRARPGRVRRRARARQTAPARADARPSPRQPDGV